MPAKTKNGNPILRISAAIKSKEGCSGDNANEVPAEGKTNNAPHNSKICKAAIGFRLF